ncbi:MAG: mechanosensitive ion channel family protein [Methanobacteriota archaeon]|nr:MAG: mechanosensitive ion channel family protein [Euryarchaeota archaeon]
MVLSAAAMEFIRALGLVLISIVIAKAFVYTLSNVIVNLAKKTKTSLDDEIIAATKKPIYYLIIVIGADFAAQGITVYPVFTERLRAWIFAAEVLLSAFFIARLVGVFAGWYAKNLAVKTKTNFDDEFLPLFNRLSAIFIYGSAIVIILDYFHYDITALVAGLGIAGLAVALAAQDTLANMIAGFVIMADRPFRIKDVIELPTGDYGEVYEIGLRSTKILTLDYTMVVIPNSEIGKSKVVNYSYPDKRVRLSIPVGVAYGTDLKKATQILKDVAKKQTHVLETPAPRVYMNSFGDFSLNLILHVWIDSHKDRFDVINRINRAIDERFRKEGIEIPFPIRTVYMKKEDDGPEDVGE